MSAKQENFPLRLWLRISELSYYHALRTNYRGIEIDKYTLIGDPILSVYGMDAAWGYPPFYIKNHDNEKNKDCNQHDVSSMSKVQIYDINGRNVASISSDFDINQLVLPAGVYIIKTMYNDGTIHTNKFIK